MAKADKATAVAEITEQFKASTATVVTEYRGLTVARMAELRRSLGDSATYSVAKNTLVKRAAADAGVQGLDELFVGPTAVAFVNGEPVDAAKALRDFAKAHPLLVIKGGLLDGRPLEAAEVTKLADLDSREVLLGKLAGAMKGTLTKAAVVLNALPTKTAQLLAALQEKQGAAAGDAPAGDSEAPVAVDAEAAAETETETASA